MRGCWYRLIPIRTAQDSPASACAPPPGAGLTPHIPLGGEPAPARSTATVARRTQDALGEPSSVLLGWLQTARHLWLSPPRCRPCRHGHLCAARPPARAVTTSTRPGGRYSLPEVDRTCVPLVNVKSPRPGSTSRPRCTWGARREACRANITAPSNASMGYRSWVILLTDVNVVVLGFESSSRIRLQSSRKRLGEFPLRSLVDVNDACFPSLWRRSSGSRRSPRDRPPS